MNLQKPIMKLEGDLVGQDNERARVLCDSAKELVEAGEYETARAALGEFWERIGERPRLDGLDTAERAQVLLRVGSLSAWLGSARQISGAQEIAKNLLTESATLFEELGLIEQAVEARIDLGTCYWREGAVDEARITLDDALMRLGSLDSEQRLRAVLNKAIVEEVSNRPQDALKLLQGSASLFETSRNHALKGRFHNEFATVLKNLGLAERRDDYIDRALVEYTAASFHFEEAGHKRFQGVVENNLGFLFVRLGKFEDAHGHLNRARAAAVAVKDRGLVAQFDDTRARAFLAQEQYHVAEQVAFGAVRALQEGDQQSQLAEALTTYGTALARLGRSQEAIKSLDRAVNLSERVGDGEKKGLAALTIIEELGSTLPPKLLSHYFHQAESSIASSQHLGIQLRLGKCARMILATHTEAYFPNDVNSQVQLEDQDPAAERGVSCSLEEDVRRYEGQIIKQALDEHGGSVTRAARSLGITHQGLAFILNGRHKDLQSARTPIKPRRRSIIRY